jgi:uncharacterized membrane protein YozB (DUF420 family)
VLVRAHSLNPSYLNIDLVEIIKEQSFLFVVFIVDNTPQQKNNREQTINMASSQRTLFIYILILHINTQAAALFLASFAIYNF